MYSFQETAGNVMAETPSKIFRRVEYIISPSHEIPQVIVAMVFLGIPFRRVPFCTGITWDELRAIICSVRPIISSHDQGPPMRVLLRLFTREAYSRASRDLALRFIPRLFKNPRSPPNIPINELDVWQQFPLLVRLSPPCPDLYRELWSILLPRAYWPFIAEMIIHIVSKWLESFPDPTMELIAFWRSGRAPAD
ncbi:hypothetical protein C8R45DRAFT_1075417, partial [Mycena sanguinolenta]